jgi:hypothetical protein
MIRFAVLVPHAIIQSEFGLDINATIVPEVSKPIQSTVG